MLGGAQELHGIGISSGCYSRLNIVTSAFKSPAAGADFSVQVPDAGAPWRLVAVRARLVTSAVAGNRFLAAVVTDNNADEIYRAGFDTALVASTTYIVTLSPAVTGIVGGVTNTKSLVIPVPAEPYLPRFSIASVTTAIDTGDVWSQVRCWYVSSLPDTDADATP